MGEDILYVDFEGIDIETYGLDPMVAAWKDKLLAVVPETLNALTKLCVHCGEPVKPTVLTSRGWVHHSGRSNCLSSSIAITFAEPTWWTDAEDD